MLRAFGWPRCFFADRFQPPVLEIAPRSSRSRSLLFRSKFLNISRSYGASCSSWSDSLCDRFPSVAIAFAAANSAAAAAAAANDDEMGGGGVGRW